MPGPRFKDEIDAALVSMDSPAMALTLDICIHLMQTQFDAHTLGLTCRRLNAHLDSALLGFTSLDGWVRKLPNGVKHGESVSATCRFSRTYYFHLGQMKWRVERGRGRGSARGGITDILWVAPEGRPMTLSYSARSREVNVVSTVDDGHHEWRLGTSMFGETVIVCDDTDVNSDKGSTTYIGVMPQNIGEVERWYDDVEAHASSLKPGYAWLKSRAVRAWVPPLNPSDEPDNDRIKWRVRRVISLIARWGGPVKPALRARMIGWLERKHSAHHATEYVDGAITTYSHAIAARGAMRAQAAIAYNALRAG